MYDGCEQVFYELTQRLQTFEANDAALSANSFEYISDSHSHVLFVEGKNKLAQLLFGRDDFFFCLISDLGVEYYVLNALKQLLLGILHIHYFLQFIVRFGLQFLRLVRQKCLVALQIVRYLEGLKLDRLAGKLVFTDVVLDEPREFFVAVLVLEQFNFDRLLVVQIRANLLQVLQQVEVVVLHEIYSGLLVLLDLLKNWPVLSVHFEMRLVQLVYAFFVILQSNLYLVLGFQTLIHDLVHLLNGSIALLLAQKCLFYLDFQLLRFVTQVHILLFALFVFDLFLVKIMEK